jgi:hypothetical protein
MKCKICKGEGWVVGYGHACDGDERACEVLCPIQVQEPCEACLGTGRRLTKRAADSLNAGESIQPSVVNVENELPF